MPRRHGGRARGARRLLGVALTGILIAGGCSLQPRPSGVQSVQLFPYPADEVWKAAEEAVLELGVPVATRNRERGLLETEPVRTSVSRLLEVAYFPLMRIFYSGGMYRIRVSVERLETNTRLEVRLHPEAYNSLFGANRWDAGESNGAIEERIFGSVERKLRRAPAGSAR